MIDLDHLTNDIINQNDDRQNAVSARLSVYIQDDEGRMTEVTYSIDMYPEVDYQWAINSKPLGRF